MEYLLFFIVLGGIGAILKNPMAALKIFGLVFYTGGVGALFGFSADYFTDSDGLIVFVSMVGVFASIFALAFIAGLADAPKTKVIS